jgi:hypothetical protein
MAGSFGYICHKSNLFNRLVHLSFSLHMMENLYTEAVGHWFGIWDNNGV